MKMSCPSADPAQMWPTRIKTATATVKGARVRPRRKPACMGVYATRERATLSTFTHDDGAQLLAILICRLVVPADDVLRPEEFSVGPGDRPDRGHDDDDRDKNRDDGVEDGSP